MADQALLNLEGLPQTKAFRKAPLTTQTFFSGLVTNRSVFNSLDNRVNRRYLGGRPDQLYNGLNVELLNIGTVARRPGTTNFLGATGVTETSINAFYSFHQLTGDITTMMDTASSIYTVSEFQTPANVYTKSTGAGQSYFQGVGNTLYVGDGVDEVAWDGINTFRNWGIAIGATSAAAYVGTGADGGGTHAWSNPTRFQGAPDLSYATNTITTAGLTLNTNKLVGSNYGFAIASGSVVTGVQVDLTGLISVPSSARIQVSVTLYNAGVPLGTGKYTNNFGTTASTISFGSQSDTWGTSLNSTIINASTFGVAVTGTILGALGTISVTFSIDAAQITVFTNNAPTIALVAGSQTTTNGGWKYVYAYGNSASGQVSNPTLASASTGNFAGQSVNITVVASTDPQVNQIRIYRTLDGGGVYYELPTSPFPNSSTTHNDDNPDSSLNTLVFWPGIPWLGNSPPPDGLTKLTYHLGRIWGAVGNYVYYSAGPDATIGNGNESFPPANFFLFPSTVNRLVPYSSGLLVFTTDDVWIILGTSLQTFYAMPFQTGVGLLSYNALDTQGTNIFLYTADRQFLQMSSSGINEIGYAIGNLLESQIDPAVARVASIIAGTSEKAVYISDGSTFWYRCNWNQPPEGGPAWSPQAVINAGVYALSSIEVTPGRHLLLMGYQKTGINNFGVKFRDVLVFTDQGSLGTELYDANFTFGSLVLAQPGQIAEVDSIVLELTNIGSVPGVSILTDEISGPFENLPIHTNDPPELTPSTTVMSNRWYLAQGANAARLRHMQIKIDFGSDTVQNELLTLSVFGGLIHEA